MTKRKLPHEKLKPGPKPKAPALTAPPIQAVAAAPVAAPPAPVAPRAWDPLQRHRDIRSMPEAELRAYARQVGIRAAEAESLATDRLRQNCTLQVQSLIEAI